jgi:hypothetical protein
VCGTCAACVTDGPKWRYVALSRAWPIAAAGCWLGSTEIRAQNRAESGLRIEQSPAGHIESSGLKISRFQQDFSRIQDLTLRFSYSSCTRAWLAARRRARTRVHGPAGSRVFVGCRTAFLVRVLIGKQPKLLILRARTSRIYHSPTFENCARSSYVRRRLHSLLECPPPLKYTLPLLLTYMLDDYFFKS